MNAVHHRAFTKQIVGWQVAGMIAGLIAVRYMDLQVLQCNALNVYIAQNESAGLGIESLNYF